MITIIKHISLFYWLIYTASLFNPPYAQSYHFHQYTIEDGLPTDAVYGAMQDRQGYIWIFTEKGVSKFDGYEFKTFTMEDGLPSNDIWDLTEGSQNRVWIQTISNKLAYIKADSVYQIKTNRQKNLRPFTIHDTEEVWFYEENGLHVVSNDTLLYSPFEGNIGIASKKPNIFNGETSIASFVISPNQFIFFGPNHFFQVDRQGVVKDKKIYDSQWLDIFHNTSNLTSSQQDYRRYFLQPSSGNYFIVTSYGIGKWNSRSLKGNSFRYEDKFSVQNLNESYPISYFDGETIQCTFKKIFFTVDKELNITDTFFLKDIDTRRVFKDRENNFWMATAADGIYFLTANARNAITFNEGEKVYKLLGRDSTILYTTYQKVYKLSGDSSNLFFNGNENERNIKPLAFNEHNQVFIGGDLFLYRVNLFTKKNDFQEIIKNLTGGDTLLQNVLGIPPAMRNTKALKWEMDESTLWVSTGLRFHKLSSINGNTPNLLTFPIRRVKSIIINEDGSLWLGGATGLKKLDASEVLISYDSLESLNQKIIALVPENDTLLWLGTEGNGVLGFDGKTITRLSSTKGIIVSALFKDEDNHLWVTSNKGVQQIYINPNNPKNNRLVKAYTTNDGLASNETNDIYVNSQYIYVATNKGLTRIDRQQRYIDDSAPQLFINTIEVNGEAQTLEDNYDLTYQENELQIAFTGLSYKSFKNIDYTYQLVGADEEWQVTKNRTVRYVNLNPGNYIFRLKAQDITGKETRLETPIQFVIHPPFWQTNWFRGIILLGVIGLVYLVYKFRIGRIKKTAKMDQQFAELELQALRSQMNPHFVFNSLTSIQYFIQGSDIDEADEYLAKFGKLMRLFLESSKTKYIALEQEIKLLRAYIEMEQLRFEEKFEVDFFVDTDIQQHYISVPSLLIQPFVENAINHGLFHKKEKGLLQLKFEKKEETIITVTLMDDGIGRKQANEIKEQSIRSYKSRGLEIVEERLRAINRMENINIRYTIQDLENNLGEPLGTKVILQIPILHND